MKKLDEGRYLKKDGKKDFFLLLLTRDFDVRILLALGAYLKLRRPRDRRPGRLHDTLEEGRARFRQAVGTLE